HLPAPPAAARRARANGNTRATGAVLLDRARDHARADPARYRRAARGGLTMNGPLVSVVMPVFNAEQFVGDALRSVHAQDYDPIEVIAVDDGSDRKSTRLNSSH